MTGTIGNINAAMARAGRLGHVQPTGKKENDSAFTVRSGVGKWLVHVVKWYSSRTYRSTVIQQRKAVLDILEQSARTGKSPTDSTAQTQQVRQMKDHLEHGSTFQKQVMDFLSASMPSRKTENSLPPGADHAITKKRPADKYATNDAALVNLRTPGADGHSQLHVDAKKFGTAYWEYASAKLGNTLESSIENDPDTVAGNKLLTYALTKDGDAYFQDTGLYQSEVVSRNNDEGINFEDWGVPNGVDKIELRSISGPLHTFRASNVAGTAAEGKEALEDFCKAPRAILNILPRESEERKIHMKSRGADLQLAELQTQLLKEEEGGTSALA